MSTSIAKYVLNHSGILSYAQTGPYLYNSVVDTLAKVFGLTIDAFSCDEEPRYESVTLNDGTSVIAERSSYAHVESGKQINFYLFKDDSWVVVE